MPTPPHDLVTIGVFARSSGITPSALRFYADSGVLAPAAVDDVTGYRFYSRDQLDRAVTLRRLREIDMPLDVVADVLDAGPGRAAALIDEHVDGLSGRVDRAREIAASIRIALARTGPATPVASVRGPVLANAIDQVLASTAHDTEHPVLTGVHLESSENCLTLTATDRYRLATRTVAVDGPGTTWSGTVAGDDLRRATPWARRQPLVEVRIGTPDLGITGLDITGPGDTRTCRLLDEPFPDHHAVLPGLDPVVTRVVVARNAFLRAVESLDGDRVVVAVGDGNVTVSAPGRPGTPVPATVHGPAVTVTFDVTTVYPAIATTAGPDLMLDVAAADRPVVVRSADDGDLTTLAMPVHPEGDPS